MFMKKCLRTPRRNVGAEPGERPQQECNFGAISTKVKAEVKELEGLSGEGK